SACDTTQKIASSTSCAVLATRPSKRPCTAPRRSAQEWLMQIIRNGAIVEDAYVHVAKDAEIPAQGDIIVPLARYVAERDALRARSGKVGVRLAADEGAETIVLYVDELPLVAIEFPTFKDG